MMKPRKFAISYVIYNENRSKFLVVQRPENDPDLPNMWGLPAGSLIGRESYRNALVRSGRQKLGVSLYVVKFIARGEIERPDYTLYMEEYEAAISSGQPKVPQPVEGVTQYQALKWGIPDDLREAAQRGSLCCRLYLESIDKK